MLQRVAGALAANDLLPLARAAGNVRGMKIAELKTYVAGNPWKNCVFVKVKTDQGLVRAIVR
jgi:hypothetical protein